MFQKFDQWVDAIGIDKYMHFGVSVILGFLAVLFFTSQPVMAFILAMLPGIAKETWDSREGGSGWSWGDLLADALGVLSALLACMLSGKIALS